MIEKALKGGKGYRAWLLFLLAVAAAGFVSYLHQWSHGLSVTGLSRNVSWGLYIANFTFFVGVAASAVTVVLPYYLHNVKEFGRITILGEFLAVPAVIMSLLFIIVDLGRPDRAFNLILHPSPQSLALLGHDRPQRVPAPQSSHRVVHPRRRTEGGEAPPLGAVPHPALHTVGGEHPYGDRIHLPGPCCPTALAYALMGAAVPCLRLCLRSCPPHPDVALYPADHPLRPRNAEPSRRLPPSPPMPSSSTSSCSSSSFSPPCTAAFPGTSSIFGTFSSVSTAITPSCRGCGSPWY